MFGRRGIFGARRAAAEAPAGDGRPAGRVFDTVLWQGERGAVLRRFGYAPDDPMNRLELQAPVPEQLARDDAALVRSLKALNDVTSYPIGAFTLLREELWRGRFGPFLMQRLDLSPFRPWNVLFLPLDAAGAVALGLPVGTHDEGDVAEIEMAVEMIAELFSGRSSPEANALAALCDTVADQSPDLFPPELLDVSPAVREARRRIRAFAFLRAVTTRLDKEVVVRNRRTFLGKPEEQLVA